MQNLRSRAMEGVLLSEVADLVLSAAIGLDDDKTHLSDSPTGWSAIVRLQRLASYEVLEASLAACRDADPLKRRVGAAVIGQLGHSKVGFEPIFVEERYRGLSNLLSAERAGDADSGVLNDVCVALGHLHDPRAIPALLELQKHPDPRVRRGVVSGLSGHSAREAIDGLIALSADSDEEIRGWSTFGLGQLIEIDTPAIRAALHARLDDPCVDVRNEAIAGLTARGDRSVMTALIRELHLGASLPLLEAAIALKSPDLCGALAVAATRGLVVQALLGPYDLTETWVEAAKACGCRKRTRSSSTDQIMPDCHRQL